MLLNLLVSPRSETAVIAPYLKDDEETKKKQKTAETDPIDKDRGCCCAEDRQDCWQNKGFYSIIMVVAFVQVSITRLFDLMCVLSK